jgi:hypothetical protein
MPTAIGIGISPMFQLGAVLSVNNILTELGFNFLTEDNFYILTKL